MLSPSRIRVAALDRLGGTNLDAATNRRLRHVHEEFAYLTGFLPALYTAEQGSGG